MAKDCEKCGPSAYDNFNDFVIISGTRIRSHTITGIGIVNSCSAYNTSNQEPYTIEEGITELGDKCFDKTSINSVSLPQSLEIIGDSCFKNSKITHIRLPKGLKKIGHSNFPSSLTNLNIPALIEEFFIDNVSHCDKLTAINVDENNTKYKSVDGVLYNHDMTEILFCPNAKTGHLIIPNSVKSIGASCFQNCKSLKTLIIPASVINIGQEAFCNSSFDKLVIPNSVHTIGQGCFKKIVIKETFKLSSQIHVLPDECFEGSDIKRFIFSYYNITKIGDNAIGNTKKDIIPLKVSFESLKYLGFSALNDCYRTETFEFFSALDMIDDDAFKNTNENIKLRYFSSFPIRLSPNAFRGLSDNATLIVPKGTKIIFQNSAPWSMFSKISESELDIDYDENEDEVIVSDETYLKRLKSVADSKNKVDRNLLKEILEDICLNYLNVESESEYNEALEVIKYNRSFSPAIVPDLEQRIWQNWSNRYKIKLANKTIVEDPASLMPILDYVTPSSLPIVETITLPTIDVTPVLPEASIVSREVVFNDNILPQLQKILAFSKKKLKIAVSWFTNYALFKQVKEIAENGIKVQLITNNDLTNNGGYCLNFNELIDAGVEISLIEYPHLLHHKFCIIDENVVVNGSYNWTRFSLKNYENITIIHNDEDAIKAFTEEFENLLQNADFKCITEMPEFVPERPEYDRNAFRQYVTEELDAEARETSVERDKITALQKAVSLNSEYLKKINPEAKNYTEAFKTVRESVLMQKTIADLVEDKPKSVSDIPITASTNTSSPKAKSEKNSQNKPTTQAKKATAIVSRENQKAIDKVKASELFMVLDVSGSMKDTYKAGHVHSISKKALSASLAITDSKEVSLWTFGKNAQFIDNVGIDTISKIEKVQCKNEGTNLMKFVESANNTIKDNALVIIFTDDDASSISNAISAMQKRTNVFWQIIVYDTSFNNISSTISNIYNASVVSLTDYASQTDDQISQLLLKDYVEWKKKKN